MAQLCINELSILIPCFNHECLELVTRLHQQAITTGISFEILVADDASTNQTIIEKNRAISCLSHCTYIEQKVNMGRAAIRNFLARNACFAYLLYIDSDMTVINDNYLKHYLEVPSPMVVDGGVCIMAPTSEQQQLLRYLYEKAEEPHHTAQERQKKPHQHLHTANLLIARQLMMQYPFDERIHRYGYEDVLLGKTLQRHRIPIIHIDNPMGFCTFESNAEFIAKTEEGLQTLCEFHQDLRGYSRLLTLVQGIHIPAILWFIRLWHLLFGAAERRNLCGFRPHLSLFRLYQLGYFVTLLKHREG